jgi:TRAF3-interacting protein 1
METRICKIGKDERSKKSISTPIFPTVQTMSLDDHVKKTADLLSRIIKKPLTPKLLSKPPFRYLHDVITETLLVSNFAPDLYTDTEQVSDNVKEKEAKIAYLFKIINVVGLATGVNVKANPAKIVAGILKRVI